VRLRQEKNDQKRGGEQQNYLEKKRTEEKELREREFRLNPCRPVPDNNRDFAMLI